MEYRREKLRRVEDVSNAYIRVQHTTMTIDNDIDGGDDDQVSCLRKFPSNNIYA